MLPLCVLYNHYLFLPLIDNLQTTLVLLQL